MTPAPTTEATTTPAPTTKGTTTMMMFRSVQSTFTSDLNNQSSAAFRDRVSMIKTQLEPVFHTAFPSSFLSLDVVSFRNGSVINDVNLLFASTSVPNNFEIGRVFVNDSLNFTGFDIERSSIKVNGTLYSDLPAPTSEATTTPAPTTEATTTPAPTTESTTTPAPTTELHGLHQVMDQRCGGCTVMGWVYGLHQ
ncbi:mucin-5AC-like, partial [Micropterus dolomieu]|uniref:mucin-5AC-like n=1 Tax=Micropterus dolomieu TaxID=147949 RepID=UPI001E8D852C